MLTSTVIVSARHGLKAAAPVALKAVAGLTVRATGRGDARSCRSAEACQGLASCLQAVANDVIDHSRVTRTVEVVNAYCWRWVIEEFFKALKTG